MCLQQTTYVRLRQDENDAYEVTRMPVEIHNLTDTDDETKIPEMRQE